LTLLVDGPPTMNAISAFGEIDRFDLTIARKGKYTVETVGKTDVVLALYGPDDPNALIGEDDDSGSGRNARLVLQLAPGKYVAAVRHYSHVGSGNYGIQVRTKG
jgi:tyrosinase